MTSPSLSSWSCGLGRRGKGVTGGSSFHDDCISGDEVKIASSCILSYSRKGASVSTSGPGESRLLFVRSTGPNKSSNSELTSAEPVGVLSSSLSSIPELLPTSRSYSSTSSITSPRAIAASPSLSTYRTVEGDSFEISSTSSLPSSRFWVLFGCCEKRNRGVDANCEPALDRWVE